MKPKSLTIILMFIFILLNTTPVKAVSPSEITNIIQVDKSTIQWDKGENTNNYIITLKNEDIKTSFITKDNSFTFDNLESSGSYFCKVRPTLIESGTETYGKESDYIEIKTVTNKKVKNLKQIAQTNNSVIIQWDKLKETKYYRLELLRKTNKTEWKSIKTITTQNTEYTFKHLKNKYTYKIKIYASTKLNSNRYIISSSSKALKVKLLPNTPKIIKHKQSLINPEQITIELNKIKKDNTYEIELYNYLTNTKLANIKQIGEQYRLTLKDKCLTKHTIFKLRVRTSQDNKTYSKWSDWYYFTNSKNEIQIDKNRIKWCSLIGADKYVIYEKDSDNNIYKRVGETKKSNYLLKNLKNNTTIKIEYYIKVKGKLLRIKNSHDCNTIYTE